MPIQRVGLIVLGILVDRGKAMGTEGRCLFHGEKRKGWSATNVRSADGRETLMLALNAVFIEQGSGMREPGG